MNVGDNRWHPIRPIPVTVLRPFMDDLLGSDAGGTHRFEARLIGGWVVQATADE